MTERSPFSGLPQPGGTVRALNYQGPIKKAPGDVVIGYVHMEGLCWTFFRYHLQLQATLAGIKLEVRPAGSLKEQLAEIDSLLREPIDVLLLRPFVSDDPGLLERIQRAQSRGVTVISLDGSVGGDCLTTTIGIDNVAGQADVVEHICRRLQGRGQIVHLQGNQNMEAGRLRTQGLHAVLERYPGGGAGRRDRDRLGIIDVAARAGCCSGPRGARCAPCGRCDSDHQR